jgi:POT family proton-dependent oligopeptide transporter
VVPSFLIPAWIEYRIGLGETPGIGWQLLSYLLLTAAEVMISVTCLEFSYTQAPRTMKSLIFGLFMASVALGNLFTSLVNIFILNEDGSSKVRRACLLFILCRSYVIHCNYICSGCHEVSGKNIPS